MSFLDIYIRYMICKHILLITYLIESGLFFLHTVKYFHIQQNDETILFQTIQNSIRHLFAQNLRVKQFYLTHR